MGRNRISEDGQESSVHLKFRTSPIKKAYIEEKAEEAGESVSNYCRRKCVNQREFKEFMRKYKIQEGEA